MSERKPLVTIVLGTRFTDVGGLQEEAPALGKPVPALTASGRLVVRCSTGTARLIGTDSADIVGEASRLLTDATAYEAMARAHNPFGDGQASGWVSQAALADFQRTSKHLNTTLHLIWS